MKDYRIIKRHYVGYIRYLVQTKWLFWWSDLPCQHVGNNSVDSFDELGYFNSTGAEKLKQKVENLQLIMEEVT